MSTERGYTSVTNKPQDICDEILTLIIKDQSPPIIQDIDVYAPYPFSSSFQGLSLQPDTPVYLFLNLLDVIGIDKELTFNRIRLFLPGVGSPVNFQVGLYQLNDSATLGDASTYPSHSTKVMDSGLIPIAPSPIALFYDAVLPTTKIKMFDKNGNENYYFLALESSHMIFVLATTVLPDATPAISTIYNYLYIDKNTSPTLPPVMGEYDPAAPFTAQFPYFVLWNST